MPGYNANASSIEGGIFGSAPTPPQPSQKNIGRFNACTSGSEGGIFGGGAYAAESSQPTSGDDFLARLEAAEQRDRYPLIAGRVVKPSDFEALAPAHAAGERVQQRVFGDDWHASPAPRSAPAPQPPPPKPSYQRAAGADLRSPDLSMHRAGQQRQRLEHLATMQRQQQLLQQQRRHMMSTQQQRQQQAASRFVGGLGGGSPQQAPLEPSYDAPQQALPPSQSAVSLHGQHQWQPPAARRAGASTFTFDDGSDAHQPPPRKARAAGGGALLVGGVLRSANASNNLQTIDRPVNSHDRAYSFASEPSARPASRLEPARRPVFTRPCASLHASTSAASVQAGAQRPALNLTGQEQMIRRHSGLSGGGRRATGTCHGAHDATCSAGVAGVLGFGTPQ